MVTEATYFKQDMRIQLLYLQTNCNWKYREPMFIAICNHLCGENCWPVLLLSVPSYWYCMHNHWPCAPPTRLPAHKQRPNASHTGLSLAMNQFGQMQLDCGVVSCVWGIVGATKLGFGGLEWGAEAGSRRRGDKHTVSTTSRPCLLPKIFAKYE